MFNKTVHVVELTTNEKHLLEELSNISCSNIECKYCPLRINITPHNNECLCEYARRVLSK